MSVFWQHVGQQNAARDFPRTLGTPEARLRFFRSSEVRDHLSDLNPLEMGRIEKKFADLGGTQFQIWGLPSGADRALSKIEPKDYFMVLDTNAEGGAFRYVGRVLCYLPGRQWDVSQWLWGSQKYPLILLLEGELIEYPWPRFLTDFKFGVGMKPMGRTYRISEQAFRAGPASTDGGFFRYLTAEFPA
jgi:hypothetical protein